MKKNNIRNIGLLLCFLPLGALAQDTLPKSLQPWSNSKSTKEMPLPTNAVQQLQAIAVGNSMPASFKNTQENQIIREEALFPIFEKLCQNNDPVRIVHIGDSHVRGHVFSVTTRRRLEQAFGQTAVYPDSISYQTSGKAHETGAPGLVYHTIGINGATTLQFTSEERLQEIADLKPDLVILSFGTNESHSKNYSSAEHRSQIDALLTLLYKRCPNTTVLLTTPPGSYLRMKRRQKVINQHTSLVVNTLLEFSENRRLPIWDLYNIAGGKSRACLNWKGGGYMQRDQVHYTHEGYRVQGALLAEAIIKAFNHYVAN